MGSNLLFSLTDGGTAGIFWGYTIVVIASIFIYLSVGEMASMYERAPRSDREHVLMFLILRSPTAGGQYHWVSELSPPWCQKYLSYITGTLLILSYLQYRILCS